MTSPLTFSAAEDFVKLPGGGAIRVCTKRDTFPDGTPFVGKGIQPDIPCAPTLAGVVAGRDEVLEAAVRYIDESSA